MKKLTKGQQEAYALILLRGEIASGGDHRIKFVTVKALRDLGLINLRTEVQMNSLAGHRSIMRPKRQFGWTATAKK